MNGSPFGGFSSVSSSSDRNFSKFTNSQIERKAEDLAELGKAIDRRAKR
jgi:hypothetical protein